MIEFLMGCMSYKKEWFYTLKEDQIAAMFRNELFKHQMYKVYQNFFNVNYNHCNVYKEKGVYDFNRYINDKNIYFIIGATKKEYDIFWLKSISFIEIDEIYKKCLKLREEEIEIYEIKKGLKEEDYEFKPKYKVIDGDKYVLNDQGTYSQIYD